MEHFKGKTLELVVDLDDPEVKKATERRGGPGDSSCLVRVLFKQSGFKQWAWLHMNCVGFELSDKGVYLELDAMRGMGQRGTRRPVTVAPKKLGVPLEDGDP